jgi:hypothetical protein
MNNKPRKLAYAYDLSGCMTPVILRFPIAEATVIEKGEVVVLTAGKVVSAGQTGTAPILGVAAEDHLNEGTIYDEKLTIGVYCSPTAVFRCIPQSQVVAEAGGSTTTIVDATYKDVANDLFNGGTMKLVEKATGSTISLEIGETLAITDFATTTGTFTFAELTTAPAVGDTFVLLPPRGSYAWGLNTDSTNFSLAIGGKTTFQVVDVEEEAEAILVKPRLHQFGNNVVATS